VRVATERELLCDHSNRSPASTSGVGKVIVRRRFFQQFRMSGKAPEYRKNGARRKTGTAQLSVGGSQLPFVAGMTPGYHGGHAPFYIGCHHFVFILVQERLGHGLFGQFRRHAATPQVMKNAGFSETVVFDPHGSVHFRKTLVVEVTQIFKARNDRFDIGQFRCPLAQFDPQFIGRAGAVCESAHGIVEQGILRKFGARLW
jgi:hypothetical protein